MSATRSAHRASHSVAADQARRPVRVDAGPEQHLGAVHVADSCQHGLVHEQQPDGRAAAGQPGPGRLGRRRGATGPGRAGRPRPAAHPACGPRRRSAPRRSAYDAVALQTHPQRTARGAVRASRRRPRRRRARGGRAATGRRRSRGTGACPRRRRPRARGRRAVPLPRRTGPAGCSAGPACAAEPREVLAGLAVDGMTLGHPLTLKPAAARPHRATAMRSARFGGSHQWSTGLPSTARISGTKVPPAWRGRTAEPAARARAGGPSRPHASVVGCRVDVVRWVTDFILDTLPSAGRAPRMPRDQGLRRHIRRTLVRSDVQDDVDRRPGPFLSKEGQK